MLPNAIERTANFRTSFSRPSVLCDYPPRAVSCLATNQKLPPFRGAAQRNTGTHTHTHRCGCHRRCEHKRNDREYLWCLGLKLHITYISRMRDCEGDLRVSSNPRDHIRAGDFVGVCGERTALAT